MLCHSERNPRPLRERENKNLNSFAPDGEMVRSTKGVIRNFC